MNKLLLIGLAALALCGCGSRQQSVQHPQAINVEFEEGKHLHTIQCNDELECHQKMVGQCGNGYKRAIALHSDKDRIVGMAYECMQNDDVQFRQAREAYEKSANESTMKRMQRAVDQFHKHQYDANDDE